MSISICTLISSQQIVLSKLFQASYKQLGGRETWVENETKEQELMALYTTLQPD